MSKSAGADLGIAPSPNFIREWRNWRGWSQDYLAEKIGAANKSVISKLENSQSAFDGINIAAIAHVIGCRPFDLISRAPEDADGLRRLVDGAPDNMDAVFTISASQIDSFLDSTIAMVNTLGGKGVTKDQAASVLRELLRPAPMLPAAIPTKAQRVQTPRSTREVQKPAKKVEKQVAPKRTFKNTPIRGRDTNS